MRISDQALAQFQNNEWKRSGSMGDLYSDQDYAWKRSGQVGNLYEDQDYNWKRSGKSYVFRFRNENLKISTLKLYIEHSFNHEIVFQFKILHLMMI